MSDILNSREYSLIRSLFSLTQEEMHKTLSILLEQFYEKENITTTNYYITATGDIPIALIAHMDTVWKTPVSELYYDENKNVMWSPNGLGADDRAGIYAILEILQRGYKPHLIFTTDEEKGGKGAYQLVKNGNPFPNLKFLVELDRQGQNDCVFYDVITENFQKYIETFGFVTRIGTYSDICDLCGAWKICGVNLSIGYYNEHSLAELLDVDAMHYTIDRVIKILEDVNNAPEFQYKERIYAVNSKNIGVEKCEKCGCTTHSINTFPTILKDGSAELWCINCVDTYADWCPICHNPYETSGGGFCSNCLSELMSKGVFDGTN